MATIDRKPANTFNFVRLQRAVNATLSDLPICTKTPLIETDTVPNAPSGLNAIAAAGQNNLTWTDNSSDETLFNVYRSTSNGFTPGPTNLIGTSPANDPTFTDSNVSDLTQYYYKVLAVNAFGLSAESNQASVISLVTSDMWFRRQDAINSRIVNANPNNPDGTAYGAHVLSFDGAAGQVVGPVINQNRSQAFTLSVWLYITDATTTQIICSNRNQQTQQSRGMVMYIDGSRERLGFILGNNNVNILGKFTDDNFLQSYQNKWAKYVITYDGSSNANGISLTVDAQAVTFNTEGNNLAQTTVSNSPMRLGARIGTTGNAELHYSGQMYDFALEFNDTGVDPTIGDSIVYKFTEGKEGLLFDCVTGVAGTLSASGVVWVTGQSGFNNPAEDSEFLKDKAGTYLVPQNNLVGDREAIQLATTNWPLFGAERRFELTFYHRRNYVNQDAGALMGYGANSFGGTWFNPTYEASFFTLNVNGGIARYNHDISWVVGQEYTVIIRVPLNANQSDVVFEVDGQDYPYSSQQTGSDRVINTQARTYGFVGVNTGGQGVISTIAGASNSIFSDFKVYSDEAGTTLVGSWNKNTGWQDQVNSDNAVGYLAPIQPFPETGFDGNITKKWNGYDYFDGFTDRVQIPEITLSVGESIIVKCFNNTAKSSRALGSVSNTNNLTLGSTGNITVRINGTNYAISSSLSATILNIIEIRRNSLSQYEVFLNSASQGTINESGDYSITLIGNITGSPRSDNYEGIIIVEYDGDVYSSLTNWQGATFQGSRSIYPIPENPNNLGFDTFNFAISGGDTFRFDGLSYIDSNEAYQIDWDTAFETELYSLRLLTEDYTGVILDNFQDAVNFKGFRYLQRSVNDLRWVLNHNAVVNEGIIAEQTVFPTISEVNNYLFDYSGNGLFSGFSLLKNGVTEVLTPTDDNLGPRDTVTTRNFIIGGLAYDPINAPEKFIGSIEQIRLKLTA